MAGGDSEKAYPPPPIWNEIWDDSSFEDRCYRGGDIAEMTEFIRGERIVPKDTETLDLPHGSWGRG